MSGIYFKIHARVKGIGFIKSLSIDNKISQLRCSGYHCLMRFYKDFAATLLNANDDQVFSEISGVSRGIFVEEQYLEFIEQRSCDIFVK